MYTFIAVYVHVYCCIYIRLLPNMHTLSAEYVYVIGRKLGINQKHNFYPQPRVEPRSRTRADDERERRAEGGF